MDACIETIVLLHGIGRTPRSLGSLEKQLKKAGFRTLNLAYPWRSMDVPQLAGFVADSLEASGLLSGNNKLHFVTHSMGGLVTAYMLGTVRPRFPVHYLGCVVMLGPPLRGSEVADALANFAPYHWFYGPAGRDLMTNSGLLDEIMPNYPLGIIAGTKGWPYLTGLLISGKHDGRVSVEHTYWPRMADHKMLPVTHSLMQNDRGVQNQVLHFIQNGVFK